MGQKNSTTAGLATSQPQADDESKTRSHHHIPSVSDIIQVRKLFLQRTPLPIELVDIILDHASYWASVVFTLDDPTDVGRNTDNGNTMILRTIPLGLYYEEYSCQLYSFASTSTCQGASSWLPPRGKSSFRQVEFHIESHDQGWGGEYQPGWGPYDGSYTWFDAYIEHPMVRQLDGSFLSIASEDAIPLNGLRWHDTYQTTKMSSSESDPDNIIFLCPDYPTDEERCPPIKKPTHLIRNRRADGKTQHHHIIWHYLDEYGSESHFDGKDGMTRNLVEQLKVGDTIAVWARARFPGWVNHVKSVIITVSWAV